MNAERIIRAAIPEANEGLMDHIIFGRTPFPVGAITPQSLYKAAAAFKRATDHGIDLCDWCHNPAIDRMTCWKCDAALRRCAEEPSTI